MRFAGNFHPEWGYLAPAPNFMRTARIVVVATAIGATAGAAVVLSLAERSAPGAVADAGKTLVVVHSLVQPAEAAAPATAPVAAAAPAPVIAPVATAAPLRSLRRRPPKCKPAFNLTCRPMRKSRGNRARRLLRPVRSRSRRRPRRATCTRSLLRRRRRVLPRCRRVPPVTEASPPAANKDVIVSPVPLAPQKDAIKKPAATGQQPQRGPQPAFAAAPKKKPIEQHGLGPVLRRLFSAN